MRGGLPEYRHIVFDEAHNLEDAATRHFSVDVSDLRFAIPLRRLWRSRRRLPEGTGLCCTLNRVLRTGAVAMDEVRQQEIEQALTALRSAVMDVAPMMAAFFSALENLLPIGTGGDAVRVHRDVRRPEQWEPILAAMTHFKQTVAGTGSAARRLIQLLVESAAEDERSPFTDGIRELTAVTASLDEASSDLDFFAEGDNADYVYWVERANAARGGARGWAAPLVVGPILAREVFTPMTSTVLCSATMTVKGRTDYLRGRLGLDLVDAARVIELDAGSPFDYPRQCGLLVPAFLTDPGCGAEEYAVALGELLADVFRVTRGRGMVLFTSYGMLKRTTAVLDRLLEGTGIGILAQGLSGTREQIMERFKCDVSSVLMGTHSFWEGVDAVGDTLSCLVVARLPFSVHTEPLVQARCEYVERQGRSAFMDYTLPGAVIRLRQGFGRLIRHRTDRGIVIVADRRIVSRRYGNWFLSSLPIPAVTVHDKDVFLNSIAERLT